MKTKLLASAADHRGIMKAIKNYWPGSDLIAIDYKTGEVQNSLGVVEGVRVILKKKRFRFERIL